MCSIVDCFYERYRLSIIMRKIMKLVVTMMPLKITKYVCYFTTTVLHHYDFVLGIIIVIYCNNN